MAPWYRNFFWSGVFAVAVLNPAAAQAASRYLPGQILVRFPSGTTIAQAQSRLDDKNLTISKAIIPELGLFLATIKGRASVSQTLSLLRRRNGILYAQADHVVTLRDTMPDDEDFEKQWSFKNDKHKGADISAPLAWDLGTGGKDRDGNDIVIAIVDGGMDVMHKELVANIWVNKGEIPANAIDDEGNGYVDDVNGWNAFRENGTIPADSHGTHVAGITGASGNNGIQVAGINWRVKIMAVAAASDSTSVVLAGYGYVLKQKKLWLETKGKKGANVVVTNSSFGVDYAKCESGEYPAWNDVYSELGKVGILSAVATANQNIDVDKKGDVPTSCASEYLIKVTNTDSSDKRHSRAAFGLKSIELGAPGTSVHSTIPGDSTGLKTGTSMATPHVTGAVAFLHSVLSEELFALVKSDPAAGARQVKALLLKGTDSIESLKGITVTGGRLNLAAAAKAANEFRAAKF